MYLLKIERKKDDTEKVKISLTHEYHEYENLLDLIDFLFENSLFIAKYSIHNMEKFKGIDGKSNRNM